MSDTELAWNARWITIQRKQWNERLSELFKPKEPVSPIVFDNCTFNNITPPEMTINWKVIKVGDYIVAKTTRPFFDYHPMLTYNGAQLPRKDRPLLVAAFLNINAEKAVVLRDEQGVYYADISGNTSPIEENFRLPTHIEEWCFTPIGPLKPMTFPVHVYADKVYGRDFTPFVVEGRKAIYLYGFDPYYRESLQHEHIKRLYPATISECFPHASAQCAKPVPMRPVRDDQKVVDGKWLGSLASNEYITLDCVRKEIKGQFPDLFPKPVTTYKIGDRFRESDNAYRSEEYILAQTGVSLVSLIGLKTGNRWNDPIKVNDPSAIMVSEVPYLRRFTKQI